MAGWSEDEGKNITLNWVNQTTNVRRLLDIGCGSGTYARLFKEENKLLLDKEWVGVEVWEPYIKQFELEKYYNVIINEDARRLDFNNLENFDFVFCGDILEHMTKEESQDLVISLLEKTRFLVISIPIIYSRGKGTNDNPYEDHIKRDWNHKEVLDSFPNIIDSNKGKILGVYLLKGQL